MRDIVLGDTRDFKFTTRQFSDGVPTTAVGLVVSAYPDNSITQITAGITTTFTSGFDGVAGLVNVRVVATGGNGYLDDTDYALVVTAGTVGGVSIVGEVVAEFSIQRAPVNWSNITAPTTAVDLSATDIQLVDTATVATTATNLTNLPTIPANWITAAGINADAITEAKIADNALANEHFANGALTSTEITSAAGCVVSATGLDAVVVDSTFLTAVENQVWDAVLTGASHNDSTSAGQRLRQIDAAFVVHEGTADGGAAGTIDLQTGTASTTDDIYNGDRVIIVAGTGVGEHGIVVDYDGVTNQRCTMAENWVVNPDATSEYILVPADADVESVQHVVQTGGDLAALITTADAAIDAVQTTADAIETDTQDLQTQIGTAGAGLTAVVWNASWDAQVQSECQDALNATFTFTKAGELDVNTLSINGATVVGDGNATPWDGA